MTVLFLTFGGPTQDFYNAVNRICNEASTFNIFDNIIGKTDIDLKTDEDFWSKHGSFLQSNRRGYGYWLWKSYLVKKQLETMNDNDILVYADAGCTLNILGKPRLQEYIQLANHDSGIVSFQMTYLEHRWTKMDVFEYLNAKDNIDTGHIAATAFILRKCSSSVNLVDQWYNTCCNYDLINDSKSRALNHPAFSDHRHDQSIWSILNKKYMTYIIPDETWFTDFHKDGINFPIWATRKRYG